MNKQDQKRRIIYFVSLSVFYLLLAALIGCDAFVRKFTRKPKRVKSEEIEMVLVPQEYAAEKFSSQELYEQYFLFWRSWHSELMDSLLENRSRKKKLDCADEALKNLRNLRPLLIRGKQEELDVHISRLQKLRDQIAQDLYDQNSARLLRKAKRIERGVAGEFSYSRVEGVLQ